EVGTAAGTAAGLDHPSAPPPLAGRAAPASADGARGAPAPAPRAVEGAVAPVAGDVGVPHAILPLPPRLGDGAADRALEAAAVPVAHPAVEVAAFVGGAPAARAALRLECFDATTDATLPERRLPLDGDGVGRFASLPDGTYRLWLDGPGEAKRWWPFVHAARGDADTRRRLVFAVGTASISGRVLGRDGRAAIDVEVGIRIEREGVTDTLVETRSGPDGRYLLDHLPPGRGVLFAQVGGADNGADEHLRNLDVVDGAALTIDLGSEVADPLWTGVVVWASGTPVRGPGALHAGFDPARGGQTVVPFGADGRFAHRVAEGPHRFEVRRPAGPAADGEPARAPLSGARVDVAVAADGGPSRVVVPGVCVRGTVVAGAADGRVEGSLVLAREPLAAPSTAPRAAPPPVAAAVGADGRFVLEGVPPGRWSLRSADDATEVVGEDGRPVVLEIAADRDVDDVRLVVRGARPR
ncbi:MAG: carboxypeptidase regulatory-like domain-containing protein, partial [Planctomycetia bacterium]|nr:carboxypeptidase regulatory-like domain-containing protein [Planctomycetia bacterium]